MIVNNQNSSQVDVESARQKNFQLKQQVTSSMLNIFTWHKYLSNSSGRNYTNYSNNHIKGVPIFGSSNKSNEQIDQHHQVLTTSIANNKSSLNIKSDSLFPSDNHVKRRIVNKIYDNELDNDNAFTKEQLTTIRSFQIKHSNFYHLSQLLFVIILLCSYNAPSCLGFGHTEYYNHPDIIGDNYSIRQLPYSGQHSSLIPYRQRQSYWSRIPRSPYDETLMENTSTDINSFQQDPSSTIIPNGQAQSWTSILNPLGLGQRPATQNNGGGGDDFDNYIKNILVPRVSGTPGNVQVRDYITNQLRRNNYQVEFDKFSASTPVGKVEFANIIASSNPNACRQLVLACHYDSKMMDGFLGAIDSAVPCAMLLKISDTFNGSFRPSSSVADKDSLGLRLIFFDGEEAYVQWTQSDSLYGSRHLAAKWAKQTVPDQCGSGKTELDRIELFVLLDLIGTSDTSFVMYNTQLKHHYEALQKYEKSYLVKSGLNQLQSRRSAAFRTRSIPLDFVEDDHVPFRKRGVPILLLLAHPFPRVWHTVADNYEAIDFPRTRRILHVMEEFVANYSSGSN